MHECACVCVWGGGVVGGVMLRVCVWGGVVGGVMLCVCVCGGGL